MESVSDNNKIEAKKGILLWDIDGTLVRKMYTEEISSHAQALKLQRIASEDILLQGLSDWDVLCHLATSNGLSVKSVEDAFLSLTNNEFLAPEESFSPCEGIDLDLFIETGKEWKFGILTGNTFCRAMHKLKITKLDTFFNEMYFYFCEKGESRFDIGSRAAKELMGERVVIIGDTPRDVELARYYNFKIIAVSTGKFSFYELASLDPDATISNCTKELRVALENILF